MAIKTTKVEPSTATPAACFADFTRFGEPMARMIAGPIEALLQWQTDALKAAEPVMMGWLERRRNAATATLETIEKLGRCGGDLGEAALIQREWLDGALKRLNADIQTLTEHAMTLSHEAVTVTRRAAQSAADMQVPAKPRATEQTNEIEAAA